MVHGHKKRSEQHTYTEEHRKNARSQDDKNMRTQALEENRKTAGTFSFPSVDGKVQLTLKQGHCF